MISKSFKICNSLLEGGSVQLETNTERKGKVSKMDRAALGTKCGLSPGKQGSPLFRPGALADRDREETRPGGQEETIGLP